MRIVLLILSIIFSSEVTACGKNGCLFNTCYTDNDQKCWRCYYGIGLDIDKSCKDGVPGIPFPQDYHVVGIDYKYQPPPNALSASQAQYYIKYAYCNTRNTSYSNDNCKNTTSSPAFELDSNNIADSIDQCLTYKRYTQSISDKYLQGRVCLVRMSQAAAGKYINVDSKTPTYVCAFNILDIDGNLYQNQGQLDLLGCQPYPNFGGPPPFLPGVIPYVSFSVHNILSYNGLNGQTTFEAPVATINQSKGSEALASIMIPIDLTTSTDGKASNCLSGQNSNVNCASISSGEPDRLIVAQNGITLGKYPRPPVEQRNNLNLHFFPCYHTYKKPNTAKVYQAVFVFSINSSADNKIGINSNSEDIYLNINSIAVLSDKKTSAGCDLCFNAAEQVTDWGDNIYTSLENKKCTLDPSIKINMVRLNDDNDNEYLYPFTDPCNPSQEQRDKAPLRVDMFDKDEQDALNKCNNIKSINYGYTSDEAFLDKYLVKVKPVIPYIDSQGEASFQMAISMPSTQQCTSYKADVSNGSVFISTSGLRDRTFCFMSQNPGYSNNDSFPLCNNSGDQTINNAVCHGLYQGSTEVSGSSNVTNPDPICIMTAGTWDFISGRYQVSYIPNLNQDKQVVPRMVCTNLPDCTTLGDEPIENIGNAIWNQSAKFNQLVNGSCNNGEYRMLNLVDNDSNRYTINEDIVKDETNKQNLKNAINAAQDHIREDQKNNKDIPYLSEEYLSSLQDQTLQKAYNQAKQNQQKFFICSQKILPRGTCIGGIYAIDKDLISDSQINPNKQTNCVQTTNYGTPVDCQ